MQEYREIKYFCNEFGASLFEGTFPEMLWRLQILICNEIAKIAAYFHFCFQNDQTNNLQINLCFEFVSAVPILKGATSVFVLNPNFFSKTSKLTGPVEHISHLCRFKA